MNNEIEIKEAATVNSAETNVSGLRKIGCASVTLFREGGIEAKFDDGSIIHVASCASSFLLQLPPHRDTPYGCGLHKIEYKTKFPTSLCRRKIRELIDLRNKQCGDNRLYVSHCEVHNSVAANDNTLEACLFGKKLPKRIEEYSWQYEEIVKNSDGSLSLWDSEKVARITLRPHRQSIDVRFLVPKSENGSTDTFNSNNTPNISKLKKCEDVSVKYVAVSPRLKSVANKEESLSSLRLNRMDRLNEADDTGGQNETASMESDDENRKRNWHQYVWVTQHFSVMAVPECWRGATNLLMHYSRHSFINGASAGISPQPVSSHPDFDNWVLADSCCSAYLHPWRQIKGFMESRESTALWDTHPITAFIIPDFTFRIIYPGEDSFLSEAIVEVDLPDGSLLRSESSSGADLITSSVPFNQSAMSFQNKTNISSTNDQPSKTLFLTHFSYKASIENVKSVTISLTNPPPKVPGQVYDLAHVGRQAFDLLAAVNTLDSMDQQQAANSCVKTISTIALDNSAIYLNSARSGYSTSTAPLLANDDNLSLTTPRLLGPYVTEQAQVDGVGEFWAYSTRRIRVAFCDGVFLDMKLMNNEQGTTDRSNGGGDTARSNASVFSSGSTSAADLPVGLARMLMKDGTYQFVNINNPPAQFTRYLLAAGEWIQWVNCPEEERETSFTSVNQIQTLVQSELDKIKRFNYIKENTVKFASNRPEPIGGPAVQEEESCADVTLTDIVSSSAVDKKSLPTVESIEDFAKQISAKSTPITTNLDEQNLASLETPIASGRQVVKLDAYSDQLLYASPKLPIKLANKSNKEDLLSKEAMADGSHSRNWTTPYTKKASKLEPCWSSIKEASTNTRFEELTAPKITEDSNSKKPAHHLEDNSRGDDSIVKTCENSAIEIMQPTDKSSLSTLKTEEKSVQNENVVPSLPQDPVNTKAEVDSKTQTVVIENSSRTGNKKKKDLQSETSYKQSELQNEIQKIIQKTRQDLELYQSPKSLSKLGRTHKSENKETISKQTTADLQRGGVTSKKAEVNSERALCVVPPPSDFADKDSADQSFREKSQINESLISRPRSPPPSSSSGEKQCQSTISSPPRSPPGTRNTIIVQNSVGSSHSDQVQSNQNSISMPTGSCTDVPRLNLSSARNVSRDESNSKTKIKDTARANGSESIVKETRKDRITEATEKTVLPDISQLQLEFDSVAQQKRDLIRPPNVNDKASVTNGPNLKPGNATISSVHPDKSPNSDNSKTPKANGSAQSNDTLQDVDKFIQENSAGLDVKFDFASVTDALFKTQQAIKTIEDMLGQRKSDQLQSISDSEQSNDTVVKID